MSFLTERQLSGELMDDPAVDRQALDRALGYLRGVNARLGGTRAVLHWLNRWTRNWPPRQPVRVIDIGTGSADIPVAIDDWARQRGIQAEITGVDLHATTVDLARTFVGDRKNIRIVQADALKLMDVFRPGEFDFAHAGLFLHHLNDVQAMTVLRIMDRLARRGVIWNDLVRSRVAMLGMRILFAWPGTPAMVRHDGIASIRAAFTRREALDLANRAGLIKPVVKRQWPHRFTLTSDKTVHGEL